MTPQDAEKAAELLDNARRNAQLVRGLDGALVPTSIDDAYAIQAALTRRRGGVAGWKIAGITPEQRATLGVPHPIAAPIFVDFVRTSPARFDPRRFVTAALEGEFAFLLGRDLPPRANPYTETEVLAAVSAVVPGVEITDQRVEKGVPMIVRLADCFGSGAYVRGPVCTDWRSLDLLAHVASVRLDGREIGRGTGAVIAGGGPVNALLQIANHQPAGSAGLKAGQFVTTGSCTGQVAVAGGREVVGNFGRLGEVLVSFAE
jgi:2-keto-4-pentenoate hydratase